MANWSRSARPWRWRRPQLRRPGPGQPLRPGAAGRDDGRRPVRGPDPAALSLAVPRAKPMPANCPPSAPAADTWPNCGPSRTGRGTPGLDERPGLLGRRRRDRPGGALGSERIFSGPLRAWLSDVIRVAVRPAASDRADPALDSAARQAGGPRQPTACARGRRLGDAPTLPADGLPTLGSPGLAKRLAAPGERRRRGRFVRRGQRRRRQAGFRIPPALNGHLLSLQPRGAARRLPHPARQGRCHRRLRPRSARSPRCPWRSATTTCRSTTRPRCWPPVRWTPRARSSAAS